MKILFNLQRACMYWIYMRCGNRMAHCSLGHTELFFLGRVSAYGQQSIAVDRGGKTLESEIHVMFSEAHERKSCNGFSVGQFTWHTHTYTKYIHNQNHRTRMHSYTVSRKDVLAHEEQEWIENVNWVFVCYFSVIVCDSTHSMRADHALRLNILFIK